MGSGKVAMVFALGSVGKGGNATPVVATGGKIRVLLQVLKTFKTTDPGAPGQVDTD